MDVTVYLPFLISGLFGCTAPALARRLPPAVATWLLSVGGLLAAAGSTGSLALLAFTLVAQNKLVAARGGWSDATLRHQPRSRAPAAWSPKPWPAPRRAVFGWEPYLASCWVRPTATSSPA